jgi:hypothetical protein
MTKKSLLATIGLIISCCQIPFAQSDMIKEEISDNDGRFYIGWGWNREWFTKSDIRFQGKDYDFELQNVVSRDKPAKFSINRYLNPANISIPQYTFRMGYFINNRYEVSVGVDHMKYVMVQNQTVKINGKIENSQTDYNKTYTNEDLVLAEDFLKFEHTDGLNYLNAAVRKSKPFFRRKAIVVQHIIGVEGGALMPRTDATLLNNPRHDAWHFAGFGISFIQGLNVTFYKHLFLQGEIKEGFISMPDIRTTSDKADKASQHFFFFQYNWWLGGKMKF